MPTPRVEGRTERFTHIDNDARNKFDDVPWIPVRSQRNADGTESHVWEKWVAFSTDPMYLALFARWDPGMIVRRHGHYSSHTLTVLDGFFTCGDVVCEPGTHIELPLGAAFGPFVAGHQGARLYEVMMGDPRSWSDEPAAMDEVLAEHGVTPLPDPPIELPAGLTDLRALHATVEGERK